MFHSRSQLVGIFFGGKYLNWWVDLCDVIAPIRKVLMGKGYSSLVEERVEWKIGRLKGNGKWVPFLQKCEIAWRHAT